MTNLTTFCDNAAALSVMEHDKHGHGHDAGTAADVFGSRLALIHVGDAQGADYQRGAYEWYPLTINGDSVGELRDDAEGLTIHIWRRNHPNRTPAYRVSLQNGRFDHVRGIEAAVARANEMLGERGHSRETLRKEWGVRIERVSAEIARWVGL